MLRVNGRSLSGNSLWARSQLCGLKKVACTTLAIDAFAVLKTCMREAMLLVCEFLLDGLVE